MVALHITIEAVGNKGKYRIVCDNLRREDATEKEKGMANLLEKATGDFMKAIAGKVYTFKQSQDDPLAESKED